MNRVVDVGSSVVSDLSSHPGGQLAPDLLHLRAHPLDDIDGVCIRKNPNPHEHGFLSGESDLGIVIFRAEHHVGYVPEPDQRAFVLTYNELFKIVCRMQVGVRGEIYLKQ